MYSLRCPGYNKQFPTLNALLQDIFDSGQDPNYYVLKDGKSVGSTAWNFIAP